MTHIEVVDRRPGTGWVVERARELHTRWGVPIVIDPGSPAGGLIADLTKARVELVEVSARDHAQACSLLVDVVKNGDLRHLGQASLVAALSGARRRQSGDVWTWSRRSSSVDITPLVAVTLALSASRADPLFAGSFTDLDDFLDEE